MAKARRVCTALLGLIATSAYVQAAWAQIANPAQSRTNAEAVDPSESAAGLEDRARVAALRRTRDAQLAVREFTAALEPARELVESREPSADPEAIRDLTLLARIQAELGDFDTAELNYLSAIDLVEAAEGDFSISLVEIYRGLGRAYIRNARYPEAITTLEQAQHITQRNLGLFNTEQAGVIDDITTAYLGLGDTTEARRRQIERLDNAIRRFGADDLRVVPFRYQLADYYQRSRMRMSAREQYEEILRVGAAELGTNHPDLLSPLRELVKIDLALTQGEEDAAHRQLVELLQRSTDANPSERALSLAVLGDWALVQKDLPSASTYYAQAWAALSEAPDLHAESFFAEPAMIDFIPPLNAVDRGTRSKPYAWGTIVLAFDVSADGRAANVRTVGANAPSGPLEERYSRRIRETHFRPRLVLGEPVATANVEFTHYFRYYVDAD